MQGAPLLTNGEAAKCALVGEQYVCLQLSPISHNSRLPVPDKMWDSNEAVESFQVAPHEAKAPLQLYASCAGMQ